MRPSWCLTRCLYEQARASKLYSLAEASTTKARATVIVTVAWHGRVMGAERQMGLAPCMEEDARNLGRATRRSPQPRKLERLLSCMGAGSRPLLANFTEKLSAQQRALNASAAPRNRNDAHVLLVGVHTSMPMNDAALGSAPRSPSPPYRLLQQSALSLLRVLPFGLNDCQPSALLHQWQYQLVHTDA